MEEAKAVAARVKAAKATVARGRRWRWRRGGEVVVKVAATVTGGGDGVDVSERMLSLVETLVWI